MGLEIKDAELHELWKQLYSWVERPLKGICTSKTLTERLAREMFSRVLDTLNRHSQLSHLAPDLQKRAVSRVKSEIKDERAARSDDQLHHDPKDERYEKNLNLPSLQAAKNTKLTQREWQAFDALIRPIGFQVLNIKRIASQDQEDLYSKALAELAKQRTQQSTPALQRLLVFEETIPLFCRIITRRSLDYMRAQYTQKAAVNNPNSSENLLDAQGQTSALLSATNHPSGQTPDFHELYDICQKVLTPTEWDVTFRLYLSESVKLQDLIQEQTIIAELDCDPSASSATKRRALNRWISTILTKLADELR